MVIAELYRAQPTHQSLEQTMPRADSDWNGDTIRRLRALWAEGHSTAEIGRRLGNHQERRRREVAPTGPASASVTDPTRLCRACTSAPPDARANSSRPAIAPATRDDAAGVDSNRTGAGCAPRTDFGRRCGSLSPVG